MRLVKASREMRPLSMKDMASMPPSTPRPNRVRRQSFSTALSLDSSMTAARVKASSDSRRRMCTGSPCSEAWKARTCFNTGIRSEPVRPGVPSRARVCPRMAARGENDEGMGRGRAG